MGPTARAGSIPAPGTRTVNPQGVSCLCLYSARKGIPPCLRAYLAIALVLLVSGTMSRRVAEMATTGDRLDTGDSHLYYEVKGEGTPVVLIHGGNLDSGMWDDDVEVFAKRWKVVRYDVRPYGRSGPLTPGYSWAEDLRVLMDHLKIDRAHLVGLSLGGRVALNFALAHPGRVDRMVLAGPGVDGWNWAPDPALGPMFEAAKAKDAAKAMELWLQHPYMAPAMRQPAVAARIRVLSKRNEHIWLASPVPDNAPEPPAIARLTEIRAPTLAIVGALDIPDIQQIVNRIVADVPGARKQVVADAGHMVNMEAPAVFQRAVVEFLSQR